MDHLTQHPLWSRNLVIATSTSFFNVIGNGLWAALLPLYYRQLGANDVEIGFAFTLSLLAQTFLQFAGGLLADRIGRRWLLLTLMLNAPLFISAGLTRDWRVVMFAIAGTRMLMGTQWPAVFALISESVPRAMQGKAFGVFEFAIGLGATIGPLIGAILLEQWHADLGALLVVHGSIIGVTSLIRAGLMQEGQRNAPPSVQHLREALSRDVRWFILAKGLMITVESLTVAGPFFALFLHDVWSASGAQINLLTSVGSFSGTMIGLWGGHWTDRVGGRRVMIVSALGLAFALLLWIVAPNLLWGFVPLLALFVLMQIHFIAQEAQMAMLTTPQTRASMVGLIGTAQNLMASASPSLGSALAPMFGLGAPFGFAIGICVLSAWAMSRVKKGNA
jgi:MFS family permease